MRLRSAAWLLAVQITGVLLSFPLSVILARVLGPAGKGTLSLVQLVAETGGLVFGMGLAGALTFYGARGEVRPRDAVGLSMAMAALGAGVVTTFVSLAPAALAATLFKTSDLAPVYFGAVGIALGLPIVLLSGLTIGQGKVRATSIINISGLAVQVLVDAVLALFGLLSLRVAIAVWLIVQIGALFAFIWLTLRGGERAAEGVLQLWKKGRRYGFATWLSNLAQYLALRQDLFLIAILLGPADVGIYTVAVTFAQLATFVPASLAGVLMPKIAGGEGPDAVALTARLTRVAWPMVAVIALAVLAVAAPLLGPVFGRSFAGAVWPLAVLVPAMIPYSVNSTLAAHLSGSGRPLIATKAWAVNVAVNVVANVLLLPRLGVVGAGLASLASYTVCATIMSVSFRRITSLPYADFLVPRVADIGDLWRALHGAVLERGRG